MARPPNDGVRHVFQYNQLMQPRCLIDGRPAETVAADDRGLNYGDGLFETLAVRDGACEFWDRHMRRLRDGCARLGIPACAAAVLAAESQQLCRGVQRAVLKIVVTRGRGGRGYRPAAVPTPTRILRLSEWPDHPSANEEQGVDIRLCVLRLGSNPALAGIKHLNRLEQVLARMEWDDPTIVEGLLTDDGGHIIEGTFSNVFVVQNGLVRTPRLDQCGVAGIMRGVVMELAGDMGLACSEDIVHRDEVADVDEIFLTNSIIGIWPVRSFEGWQAAAPGPVTHALQQRLRQLRQSAT